MRPLLAISIGVPVPFLGVMSQRAMPQLAPTPPGRGLLSGCSRIYIGRDKQIVRLQPLGQGLLLSGLRAGEERADVVEGEMDGALIDLRAGVGAAGSR